MLEHDCDAGMPSVVMHDVSGLWLSGVVPFQVCGCWCLYVGPRLCWHILGLDVLVLCKLGVWFCVGMCECFCG